MSSSPTYLDPVIIPLILGDTVLDVGCGYGRWGNLIQSNFWEAGLKKVPLIDGIDAFEPNVEFCSKHHCYRNVWHQILPSPLLEQWDTVLACEIIEHIEQEKVEKVINDLEKAARKRVIFSTPNWPYYRAGGETTLGFNDYEAHLSYVSRHFFRRRGYKLLTVGFGNPTNILVRAIRKLKFSREPALHLLPRLLPMLGDSLVAYKDVSNN